MARDVATAVGLVLAAIGLCIVIAMLFVVPTRIMEARQRRRIRAAAIAELDRRHAEQRRAAEADG